MNTAYCWYRPNPSWDKFYPGKTLYLTPARSFIQHFSDLDQVVLVKKYFSQGLSPHGFLSLQKRKPDSPDLCEPIIELIFELVRQHYFSDRPSRLSCLYASKTIDQALQWHNLWCKNFSFDHRHTAESLWEIEFDSDEVLCDANFLNIFTEDQFSFVTALDHAYRYWNGESTQTPLPELLVRFPVTVIRNLGDICTE